MKRFIFVLLLGVTSLTLSGCNDLIGKLNMLVSSESSAMDKALKEKFKTDLSALDNIRLSNQAVDVFESDKKISLASRKSTSNLELRLELKSLADQLTVQNESFKTLHLHTPQVAKMRNIIMETNYNTIQILALIDNPQALDAKLAQYLSKQKKLHNDYNKLRTLTESEL